MLPHVVLLLVRVCEAFMLSDTEDKWEESPSRMSAIRSFGWGSPLYIMV